MSGNPPEERKVKIGEEKLTSWIGEETVTRQATLNEVRCKVEFKDMLDKTSEWVDKQKQLTETTPTPEKVEEITKLYEDVVKKSKDFAKCEVK